MADSVSPPGRSDLRTRVYGRTGALAALLVLFLDLLWRSVAAPTGVVSIPETVVAAVARLTPTAVFGWATETFGSLAQNTLFAVVLLGVVGAGAWAGRIAGLGATGRFGAGFAGRLVPAGIMAGVLFLIVAAGIFPLAREGFFAAGSPHQGLLLAQAALIAAGWAVAWAALATLPAAVAATPDEAETEPVTRRSALRGIAAAGLGVGVAVLGWRLAKTPAAGDVAAQQRAAAEIAARAGGNAPSFAAGGAPGPAGTTGTAELTLDAPDAADSDAPLAQWDPSPEKPFAELEAEGKLTPVITSVADFYHVSKNISDPVVDGTAWQLTIGGMVETPLSFSYDDIMARATTQNITTLSCISNELNGDLAGTAEWTGFPLRELLEEAGVNPDAVDIVFRAADGYDDSIPLAQAMHPTTLLVTGMNGEPLPPDHGFPARLIVPPIYGMKNVKWVEQIEAVDHDYQGFWQTRGWSDPAPYQIWGRIDTPAQGQQLPAGPAVTAGVAAAGNRGIFRVEISLDEGATWEDATLEPSINPDFTWVRWVYPFEAIPGVVKIWMRATDGEGTVAPQERNPPLPNGATGWPERVVQVAEG
ncbi:MAG: oxidoreductase molybdopterin binding protein [Thermomicrobiales bacterium]|nr:oxidoreductase molybdopterin binding protein [Thermomicrobiales bacterium]